MDSEAAPPSSPSPSPSPGSPRRSSRTRRRRLYRILRARLTTPILTSLLLLPILPSSQLNLVFQLVPFFRSARALLTDNAELHAVEQWLSYWLLYAGVRLLESTRFRLDSLKEVQHLVRIVPRFLFSSAVARLSARTTPPASTAAAAAASASVVSKSVTRAQQRQRRQRTQTLAAQLAGTPLRWTLFKSVLLFYAMDEELQGARWILEKLVKPCAAFFTGLEGAAGGGRMTARRLLKKGGDDESEDQEMAHSPEGPWQRQRGSSTRRETSGKRDVVLGSTTGTGTAGPEDAAQQPPELMARMREAALPSPAPSSPSTLTLTDTSTGGSTGGDGDEGIPLTPDNDNDKAEYGHASLQPHLLSVGDLSAAIGTSIAGLGWSDASIAITTNADANLADAGIRVTDAHKGSELEVVTGGPSLSLAPYAPASAFASPLRLEGNDWV